MRLFIASKPSEKIKKELGELQNELERRGIKARWVKPDHLHLTFVFLGDFPDERIPFLKVIIKKAVRKRKPFFVSFDRLISLPSGSRPRLVAVSPTRNFSLQAFANAIRQALCQVHIQFDNKPFFAHMTIGRLVKPARNPLTLNLKPPAEEFFLDRIFLISSVLNPSGSLYKTLSRFFLERNRLP